MLHLPGRALRRTVWSFVKRSEFEFTARTRFGAEIRGHTRDLIQRHLYYFGVWEPSTTAWIRGRLAKGDTFVDVGANIGYYTLLGAAAVGETGRVVAIEALPQIFAKLESHVALNGLRNVRLVNAAATSQPQDVEMWFGGEDNTGSSSMIDKPTANAPSVVVPGRPLADILTREERANARLIKIDVEGAEREVLAGLDLDAGEYRRDLELLVEITPARWADGGHAAALLERLRGYGFNAYRLDDPHSFRCYLPNAPTGRPYRIEALDDGYSTVVFSRVDAPAL
jgi:FkbM family methyltransferase